MIFNLKYWIFIVALIVICLVLSILLILHEDNHMHKSQKFQNIPPKNAQEFEQGEILYAKHCLRCHGEIGEISPPIPQAPALNEYGNVWKYSSKNIAQQIMRSPLHRNDVKMPAFVDKFSLQDINNLINYIINNLPDNYLKQRRIIFVTDDKTKSHTSQ